MQCMRCGREISAEQVFCEECLRDMERHPVKPGTVVHIPKQPARPQKRPERRTTTEQQLAALRRQVQILSFSLTLSVALLIGVSALAFSLYQEEEEKPPRGQNYSTVDGAPGVETPTEDVSRETSEAAE